MDGSQGLEQLMERQWVGLQFSDVKFQLDKKNQFKRHTVQCANCNRYMFCADAVERLKSKGNGNYMKCSKHCIYYTSQLAIYLSLL